MYWVCEASHEVEGGEWSQSIWDFVHIAKPRSWMMESTPKPPFMLGPNSPTVVCDTLCPHLRYAATSYLWLEGPGAFVCLVLPLCHHHPHYASNKGGQEINLFPPNLNPSKTPTLTMNVSETLEHMAPIGAPLTWSHSHNWSIYNRNHAQQMKMSK